MEKLIRTKYSVKRNAKTGPKQGITEEVLFHTELLSKLGASNAQLALFFDKNVSTIDYWIKAYPEFRAARKKGGIEADMNVVRALYQRAIGYDYWEEQIFMVKGEPVQMSLKKHALPEMKAIMFWLSNKQRELWGAAHKIHHTGNVNHVHNRLEDIPIEQLSLPAQKLLFEIGQKQLTDGSRDN